MRKKTYESILNGLYSQAVLDVREQFILTRDEVSGESETNTGMTTYGVIHHATDEGTSASYISLSHAE
jgi:hypothetical protein